MFTACHYVPLLALSDHAQHAIAHIFHLRTHSGKLWHFFLFFVALPHTSSPRFTTRADHMRPKRHGWGQNNKQTIHGKSIIPQAHITHPHTVHTNNNRPTADRPTCLPTEQISKHLPASLPAPHKQVRALTSPITRSTSEHNTKPRDNKHRNRAHEP